MLMTMRYTEDSSFGLKASSIHSIQRCPRIEQPRRIQGDNNSKKVQVDAAELVVDDKFWEARPAITSWADEVEAEEEEEMGVSMRKQHPQRLTAVVAEAEETERMDTDRDDGKETQMGEQDGEGGQGRNEEDAEGEPILFVGGILFNDLEKVAMKEGKEKLKELRDIRIRCMIEILEGFGEVKLLKRRWDRRYCHVVYAKAVDAKKAYECLTSADERQKMKAIAQKKLQAAGLPTICAPSKYYARWSTKEELAGKKKGR